MYKLFEEPDVLAIELAELDGAVCVVTLMLWLEVELETAPLPPVVLLLAVYD